LVAPLKNELLRDVSVNGYADLGELLEIL
jgi:hypothetical protein